MRETKEEEKKKTGTDNVGCSMMFPEDVNFLLAGMAAANKNKMAKKNENAINYNLTFDICSTKPRYFKNGIKSCKCYLCLANYAM